MVLDKKTKRGRRKIYKTEEEKLKAIQDSKRKYYLNKKEKIKSGEIIIPDDERARINKNHAEYMKTHKDKHCEYERRQRLKIKMFNTIKHMVQDNLIPEPIVNLMVERGINFNISVYKQNCI